MEDEFHTLDSRIRATLNARYNSILYNCAPYDQSIQLLEEI